MRYLKSLATLMLAGSLSVSADTITEECENEWPGNYQMQEYCAKKAAGGARAIHAFLARHDMTMDNWVKQSVRGKVPALILKKCNEEWHPDLKMIAYCLEKEEVAAIRLGKIGGAPEDSVEFEPGINGEIAALGVSSDYLKRHNYGHVDEAKEAADRGDPAGIIWVECQSGDHRKQAKCLLKREAAELE
ncbi:MAG: hypothetical protein COB05_04590 [Marinobacter sp.]|nr:MAG: hypothetical protein COB05_04590 [Marinobacter sp.]